MNQELDALNSRKGALEDELAMSQVKKEAVVLYDQLREVEDKRDQVRISITIQSGPTAFEHLKNQEHFTV